jgi:N-acetylneuraminate synthase
MRLTQIGGRPVGGGRPFLILDAGVNHGGVLAKAIEMVDAAADAGGDAIKFQSYKAGGIASRESPAYWDRSKEPSDSQYELFRKYDSLGPDDYRTLADRCREKGISFLSTFFDNDFLDALDPLVPAHKVASADLTNVPFLRRIARKGKPVLLSTGASTLDEVVSAVRLLEEEGVADVALLHCVLEYPTLPGHAHLAVIKTLGRVFPECSIGWSDHVPPGPDGCLSLLTAWLLGAEILEKHYTLDKSLPGNDHYHAMDPDDIRVFLRQVETVRSLAGEPDKRVYPWEEQARLYARRSLVAAREIPAGSRLTDADVVPKRPGTGIPPVFLEVLLGKKARVDIREDQVLTWPMFLEE